MVKAVIHERLEKPDERFGAPISETEVDRIMSLDPFNNMDQSKFTPTRSLRDIICNDMRIRNYRSEDIVTRAGDYGNTAFLLISGLLRVVLPPGLSEASLGRIPHRKKGFISALSQLWKNDRYPEVRRPADVDLSRGTGLRQIDDKEPRMFLQDIPNVLDEHRTAVLAPGELFGEIAALGRTPRSATIFAESDCEVLEIRWRGLRDIRRCVDDFRHYIDTLYRERSLRAHLHEMPNFRHLGPRVIEEMADETLFETYGNFEWHATYKRFVEVDSNVRLDNEPLIAKEGSYPDGLLLIRSGFARVTRRVNYGEQTVKYLGRGEVFGLDEIYRNWRENRAVGLKFTLRAVGYTDILRVPTLFIEKHVLPGMPTDVLASIGGDVSEVKAPSPSLEVKAPSPSLRPGMLEFLVENRYINGTAAMLIDLDRCVRCDACVEACAAGHNNNPRFIRHGRKYDHFMVANACMHCTDPVCMIGCPTGAISRSLAGGEVVIRDDTCIGCATCANSCPYDNIRMVETRDEDGIVIQHPDNGQPVIKATKCDLCLDQPGGPACQRACPHDALVRVDMQDLTALANWLER